MMLGTYPVD